MFQNQTSFWVPLFFSNADVSLVLCVYLVSILILACVYFKFVAKRGNR